MGGNMAAIKRPGVIAVHSLDRFAFSVPKLGEAKAYFTNFGLDVREVGNRIDLYTFGHPHRWGSVFESGKKKKIEYLSFGVYAEDFEPLRRQIEKKGIKIVDPHPLVDQQGFWLRDPEGVMVQVVVAEKSSPARRDPSHGPLNKKNRAGVEIGFNRSSTTQVKPLRLTHALLFSSDVPRSVKFYDEALGLRLSDHSGDGIGFMHAPHASDHHVVAFAKSDGPGLHHTSWIVRGIDEIGIGMEQIIKAGYPYGWGVGRHVLGSNYFYYSRDPWGSFTEYSCEIDFVPADVDWPVSDHPAEDSFYLWGPDCPADFVLNKETAA